MGNSSEGLKIKPSKGPEARYQQSYPQFMGLNAKSVTNQ